MNVHCDCSRDLIPEVGDSIRVTHNDGPWDNFFTDRYLIKGITSNPNNRLVPYAIETCCGNFVPTSYRDGHWKNEIRLVGWEPMYTPLNTPKVSPDSKESV